MSRSVYRRDGGWRLRWEILVAGDLLADCLAYLLAFVLRTHVPLPLTQGYLPGVRFAEVHHHRPEMLLAQGAVLYFLGLYEVHALTRPRDHVGAMLAAAGLQELELVAAYFFRQDLWWRPRARWRGSRSARERRCWWLTTPRASRRRGGRRWRLRLVGRTRGAETGERRRESVRLGEQNLHAGGGSYAADAAAGSELCHSRPADRPLGTVGRGANDGARE